MDINLSNILPISKIQENNNKEIITTRMRLYDESLSLLKASERILSSGVKLGSYDIVIKYDFITVREKNGHRVVETTKSKQKNILLYYKCFDVVNFNEFLFDCLTSPKLLVLHVTTSYKLILEKLIHLAQLEISFDSFTSKNLLFCKKTYKPVITRFENASITYNDQIIAFNSLNELYLSVVNAIIDAFSLQYTILNELTKLISNNREKKEILLAKLIDLYAKDKWDFVYGMKHSDMETFILLLN
jgi:hypothetical protein